MTSRQRNVGGRGNKAESKNVVVSVSIPTHIKDLIDLWAVGVIGGRSEVVARLVEQEAARRSGQTPAATTATPRPTPAPPAFAASWNPQAGDELEAGPGTSRVTSHAITRHQLEQGARLIFDGETWQLDGQPQSRIVVGQMLNNGVLVRKNQRTG
jgi:hypothetical protein